MRYLVFPGISAPVSQLVCGCDRLRFQGEPVLEQALAAGINAFDTASAYPRSEQMLGRWAKRRGVSDQLVMITKVGYAENRVDLDPDRVLGALDRSADALARDAVDLLLLHYDDPATPAEVIAELVARLRATGRARAIGGANFELARVQAIRAAAQRIGDPGFDAVSAQLSLPEPTRPLWPGSVTLAGPSGATALDWYREQRIPVLAYSCLGRGFFTAEYQAGAPPPARLVPRDLRWLRERMDSPANRARYDRVRALADRLGKTPAQVALAWVLREGVFATVGWTEAETLRENLGAFDVELTETEAVALSTSAA